MQLSIYSLNRQSNQRHRIQSIRTGLLCYAVVMESNKLESRSRALRLRVG